MTHGRPPAPRAATWSAVPDTLWNDWRWQLASRLETEEELSSVLALTDAEKAGLAGGPGRLKSAITPYLAGLMDGTDPRQGVRRQVVPTGAELHRSQGTASDPLGEATYEPVPGLIHRYTDRVLMIVTTQCASYCRYCTRGRIVGQPATTPGDAALERQIAYIRARPEVRDVLLSGGDPLTLSDRRLERILSALRAIGHVEIVRIGTRVPVFLPMRVTPELCAMLARFHPLWINVHANHPDEVTAEFAQACGRLADAGIPLGNQCVLLRGINDTPDVQMRLAHALVRCRVRPYYLYHCDAVTGAGHFRTPIAAGIRIVEALQGHTSGFCVPSYVVDLPGGGGKVRLGPENVIPRGEGVWTLRNHMGDLFTVPDPSPGGDDEPL